MHPQLGISIHGVGTEYVKKAGFKRVQICQKFSQSQDVTSLLKLAREKNIKISYHAPVFHQADPAATYYLSTNSRLIEATFEILEINMRMAKCLPADYVVIHFTSKTMKSESYESKEQLMDIARESLERLDLLSENYGVNINLEYSSYGEYFNDPSNWIELVRKAKRIGLCLDLGQLYKDCKAKSYDFYEKLEELLPYTRVVHIWNMKEIEDLEEKGYIPVHPSQKPEEGWIDIKKSIDIIKSQNRDIPIIFEPNFTYKGEDFFSEGIDWVNHIMETEELEVINI
jgi:sugar phosphate isomerase/epimerase